MKPGIRCALFCSLFIAANSTSFADAIHPTPVLTQTTPTATPTSSNELIDYVNNVLLEAGFPNESRKYLVDTARTQLAAVHPGDLTEKKRTLQRNLYIFLKETSEKYMTPKTSDLIHRAYYLAELDPEPWNYILSAQVLDSFKQNHVFDEITISDIEDTNEKFCPVWPFCKE